ncbi:MAG: DNA polymerase I [Deltaproteobacteria bacterium]|nr:DNA polymerase I [Deltaproteobacteria bacterium]
MENDMDKERKKVFIIDGSYLIYRAFHAVPPTFTTSAGLPTNAVFGFTQSLRKILNDFKPEYIGMAFDVKGPSFRHEMFTGYKAERKPMPDLLSVQIPYIKRMARAFNIPSLEMSSFEADDIIATIVKRLEGEGVKTAIITGDKDMYQLVDDNTVILDYLSGKEHGLKEVIEKFGVEPGRIKDLLALAGDSSDSIPGVTGVGFKTAAKLLKEFGSLEGIFDGLEGISKDKLRESLKSSRDKAFLSRDLATLHPEVPIECGLETLKYQGPDFKELETLLNELEFMKLLKEIVPEGESLIDEDGVDCSLLTDEAALRLSLSRILGRTAITVFIEGDGPSGRLIGVSAAESAGAAFYAPSGSIPESAIAGALKGFLENSAIRKDTDNAKALHIFSARHSIKPEGICIDTSLASYVINPSKPGHSIGALAREYLGSPVIDGDIAGMAPEEAAAFSCRRACKVFLVSEILRKELEDSGLFGLYDEMELPLAGVLAKMETAGIKVDRDLLSNLSKEMEIELASIEARIYASAGMEFNINSPKQLSELLFEKLKLKPVKKTKTGFSTDEEVLTQLAARHEVPSLIIGYRQLSKLKSTYVDALLELVDPTTGRVHTSFNQTVTSTGRLSSSRPNLQNIPIRSASAWRIREAFVAEKGFRFLCADYSQIELRIVAHMSGDPVLIDAFTKGEDIHSRTASEVFGVLPALVSSEMRRRAKAINFGIIYGMGPYGLSAELGISMKEALEYIERYFIHYRSVKELIDRTVAEASERGYTMTLFGRRRFIPELKSPIEQTMRLGQRLAINTPIQGTAADMIKAAMVTIDRRLREEGRASRMILQIHDELIFEVIDEEFEAVDALVREEMEGVIELKVPVKVNVKSGINWNAVE